MLKIMNDKCLQEKKVKFFPKIINYSNQQVPIHNQNPIPTFKISITDPKIHETPQTSRSAAYPSGKSARRFYPFPKKHISIIKIPHFHKFETTIRKFKKISISIENFESQQENKQNFLEISNFIGSLSKDSKNIRSQQEI